MVNNSPEHKDSDKALTGPGCAKARFSGETWLLQLEYLNLPCRPEPLF